MKYRFTHHALDELKPLNLSVDKAYWMVCNSELESLNGLGRNKRYSADRDIRYKRNGTVIFTIKETQDKFNPEQEIGLVLSVYDQRLDLR